MRTRRITMVHVSLVCASLGCPSPHAMLDPALPDLLASYRAHPALARIGSSRQPSPHHLAQAIELLRDLVFPGFRDPCPGDTQQLTAWTNARLARLRDELTCEIALVTGDTHVAAERTTAFMVCLPSVRARLSLDVQAAFAGDPAATCPDEAILCYPGLEAIFTHRVAHELHRLGVPLIPRMMAELAHSRTGADIHPGATIGESFFIDHATGVVIGETCVIGARVKIYQGVTLGALSTREGQGLRGVKRHPTIEDDVTIYPNASVLGGQTTVGARSVINGGVFLTHSVPADHTVRINHPAPQLRGHEPLGPWSHWSI
jgi:serine O-acetyltransferase